MYYEHYDQVPQASWRWRHFTPREIASKGDGSILIDEEALDKLEYVRELMGQPLIILSAYRDPLHNAKVGGAPLSQHKFGKAFDIRTQVVVAIIYLATSAVTWWFGDRAPMPGKR